MATANHAIQAQFSYRQNKDNSIDSICLRCYLTAGTADSEAELHELEGAHECPKDEPEVPEVA